MQTKEKIKEIWNQYNVPLFYIFLFIIVMGRSIEIAMPIEAGDAMWNFSNIYKLVNGTLLYRDNNVIITPLFFYIGKFLFSILGNNILIFRIYNGCICWLLLVQIHRALLTLNVDKKRAVIYILIIYLSFVDVIRCGANYNSLAMVIWVMGLISLLKNKEKDISVIKQSLFVYTIFLLKQNIGIYYIVALNIYGLYVYRRSIKKYFLFIIKQTLSYIVMGGSLLLWLNSNGELFNFINYCFLGVNEFANKNFYFVDELLNYICVAFPFIIAIFAIIVNRKLNKEISKEKKEHITILFSFLWPNFLIVYPLVNVYHAKLGIVTAIILGCYLLDDEIKGIITILQEKKQKLITYSIVIIGILITVILVAISLGEVIKLINTLKNDDYYFPKDHAYYGAGFTPEEEKRYQAVQQWIINENNKGKDCVIFSTRANIYMLPLGQNHQDFDLPNLGNWGRNGEERVLNKIRNLRNTNILIAEEKGYMSAQESEKILKYIKENFNYKGKIEDFLIYETNE